MKGRTQQSGRRCCRRPTAAQGLSAVLAAERLGRTGCPAAQALQSSCEGISVSGPTAGAVTGMPSSTDAGAEAPGSLQVC